MDENNIRCSIVMATYNGEKYIEEQIESILANMKENDELIISDDGSSDSTRDIIKKYIDIDKRIKLIEGPRKGVKQNFANGIQEAKGKYIFLSDQDDIWNIKKIDKVLQTLTKENCTLVVHDAEIVNEKLEPISTSFFEYRNSGTGILKNIWKNTYIGCCMAFDSKIKNKILPIPDNIEMHDQWIGIMSELQGKVYFLQEILMSYRRHQNNVSKMKHYGILKMIKNRICFSFFIVRRRLYDIFNFNNTI